MTPNRAQVLAPGAKHQPSMIDGRNWIRQTPTDAGDASLWGRLRLPANDIHAVKSREAIDQRGAAVADVPS